MTEKSPECPVDHNTREAFLEKARRKRAVAESPDVQPSLPAGESCDSSTMNQKPESTKGAPEQSLLPIPKFMKSRSLSLERETSTIPRAETIGTTPANNEQESGTSKSGNWIYPSEQMFFDAMKRKNYDPKSRDMQAIVPIHNAVNERAWGEIRRWESGWGSERCGGPRLLSFAGTAKAMTPKARLNTLLGYQAPFDRHDWAIDRCGVRVDYVIDFYAGRDEGKGKSLNFFLDVRPKLNTWEGCKMRAGNFIGVT